MAEVRKRNTKVPVAKPTPAKNQDPVRRTNLLFLIVAGVAALAVYYFQFQSSNTSSSSKTPFLPRSSSPSTSSIKAANGNLHLTDPELAAFTGADPEKPIYVALNGTVFDVSSGRSFYGPGGHYGHFAGRDATRAWVSTCFQPEYLTWDMKGVEKMFMPKWMDEEMEDAANGGISDALPEAIKKQAATLLKKVGKVSEAEKQARRVEDAEIARVGIEEAMKHWMDFFRNNPKYAEVGVVVGRKELDEEREDIGLCEEALKKRPIKGGRFGNVLEKAADMGMDGQGQNVPDFVKGKNS